MLPQNANNIKTLTGDIGVPGILETASLLSGSVYCEIFLSSDEHKDTQSLNLTHESKSLSGMSPEFLSST